MNIELGGPPSWSSPSDRWRDAPPRRGRNGIDAPPFSRNNSVLKENYLIDDSRKPEPAMTLGLKTGVAIAAVALGFHVAGANAQQPRNVVLFIPDGLRALAVTPETAPTMAAILDNGVDFRNPHSLFPTFTMPNSSGMATGHFLGDTGVFSNTLFSGYPVPQVGNSVTPFIENDAVLGDIDAHFGGSFVSEETILAVARHQGLSTAAIGKLGPTLMFDHTERSGE